MAWTRCRLGNCSMRCSTADIPVGVGATPQACVQHRRDHLHELRRRGAHRGQRRRPHRHPRHPRSLRQTRRAGARALPAPTAAAQSQERPRSPSCENQYRARCGDDPAGLRSARCRESAGNGRKLAANRGVVGPSDRRTAPQRRPAGACDPAGYPADCPKRAFEFPILRFAGSGIGHALA